MTSKYIIVAIVVCAAILIVAGAAVYWYSKHPYDVLEAIGNIIAVAVFIGIAYLILHFIIKYG